MTDWTLLRLHVLQPRGDCDAQLSSMFVVHQRAFGLLFVGQIAWWMQASKVKVNQDA